jgi:hypothetical protein
MTENKQEMKFFGTCGDFYWNSTTKKQIYTNPSILGDKRFSWQFQSRRAGLLTPSRFWLGLDRVL